MNVIRLQSMLPIAILAVAFSTAARASDDKAAAAVSKHDLQAKIDYCETCHGLSGEERLSPYGIPGKLNNLDLEPVFLEKAAVRTDPKTRRHGIDESFADQNFTEGLSISANNSHVQERKHGKNGYEQL